MDGLKDGWMGRWMNQYDIEMDGLMDGMVDGKMKIDRIARWICGAIMELSLKMIDKQTDTLSICRYTYIQMVGQERKDTESIFCFEQS